MKRGVLYVMAAYIFWGLHPVYWKQLVSVAPAEIVSHRIIWSFLFFIVIVSIRRGWKDFFSGIKGAPNKWMVFLPALLIGSNWTLYIWAVNAGYIIETSLGYFIAPLVSVCLGLVVLKERIDRTQAAAVGIAVCGVLVMTVVYGQFPWISLLLAGTWGLYGLLRKKSPLGPVEGLTLETLVLSIPAAGYLFISGISNGPSAIFSGPVILLLLIGTGIISGLPLVIYITGARIIDLSLVGVLQFSYPTIIFLIGHFIYGESLDRGKLAGFIFIWTSLIIYAVRGVVSARNRGAVKNLTSHGK